jgi:hypothetical protein
MWRFSTVKLLGALVLLIIMTPFFEEFAQGDLIEALMITLVLVAAVIAIGGKRPELIAAALLLVPAIVGKWLSYAYPQTFPPIFSSGLESPSWVWWFSNCLVTSYAQSKLIPKSSARRSQFIYCLD